MQGVGPLCERAKKRRFIRSGLHRANAGRLHIFPPRITEALQIMGDNPGIITKIIGKNYPEGKGNPFHAGNM